MKVKHKAKSNEIGLLKSIFTRCGDVLGTSVNQNFQYVRLTPLGERAYKEWKYVTCKECLKTRR